MGHEIQTVPEESNLAELSPSTNVGRKLTPLVRWREERDQHNFLREQTYSWRQQT